MMLRALGDNLLLQNPPPALEKLMSPCYMRASLAVYCLSDQPVALTQIITESVPVGQDPATPLLVTQIPSTYQQSKVNGFPCT